MASSPASPNPVGLWFCQISSGLQGRCQSQSSRAEQQGAGRGEAGAGDAAVGSKDDQPTRTCRGGGMPEATVYLLLDRFAPS